MVHKPAKAAETRELHPWGSWLPELHGSHGFLIKASRDDVVQCCDSRSPF